MTFSTHEIDDKCRIYRVLVKNPQENEHFEAVSIGEVIPRIIEMLAYLEETGLNVSGS